jgi:hypothetical protein
VVVVVAALLGLGFGERGAVRDGCGKAPWNGGTHCGWGCFVIYRLVFSILALSLPFFQSLWHFYFEFIDLSGESIGGERDTSSICLFNFNLY